jgi:hypothetical protein
MVIEVRGEVVRGAKSAGKTPSNLSLRCQALKMGSHVSARCTDGQGLIIGQCAMVSCASWQSIVDCDVGACKEAVEYSTFHPWRNRSVAEGIFKVCVCWRASVQSFVAGMVAFPSSATTGTDRESSDCCASGAIARWESVSSAPKEAVGVKRSFQSSCTLPMSPRLARSYASTSPSGRLAPEYQSHLSWLRHSCTVDSAMVTARVVSTDTSVPSVMPELNQVLNEGTCCPSYFSRMMQRATIRAQLESTATSSPSHQSSTHRVYRVGCCRG